MTLQYRWTRSKLSRQSGWLPERIFSLESFQNNLTKLTTILRCIYIRQHRQNLVLKSAMMSFETKCILEKIVAPYLDIRFDQMIRIWNILRFLNMASHQEPEIIQKRYWGLLQGRFTFQSLKNLTRQYMPPLIGHCYWRWISNDLPCHPCAIRVSLCP